jgi:hypothetical protein
LKAVPLFPGRTLLRTRILPLCRSMIRFDSAKPNPVPPPSFVLKKVFGVNYSFRSYCLNKECYRTFIVAASRFCLNRRERRFTNAGFLEKMISVGEAEIRLCGSATRSRNSQLETHR